MTHKVIVHIFMVHKLIKYITNKKQKNMKKIVALFAIAATTMLASCGNGTGKSTEAVDSTAVAVDSVKVDSSAVAVDSVKADVEKVEEVK